MIPALDSTVDDSSYSLPDELRPLGVEVEFASCAFCGSDAFDFVLVGRDRLHNGPGRFRVVKCRRCGLMRTNPRPTVASMSRYYPSDYEPYIDTASENRHYWRHWISRRLGSVDIAIPSLPPGDLLEIGPASGNFLLAMQRSGWRVTGVEFDPTAAATAARRTGARVITGDLLAATFPRTSFDLICAWMVFEHLHDPVLALRRSFEWLRRGGWLAFSVPDAGNWQFRTFRDAWFALQVPRHLYHFSEDALRRILNSCGYDELSVKRQPTLFDVGMSVAYRLEEWRVLGAGRGQRLARSVAWRAAARAAGVVAGPFGLSARLTVWARRPE